jgi:hypothetical protein
VLYSVFYEYDQITTFSPRETVTPPQSPLTILGPFGGFSLIQPRVIQGEDVFGAIQAIAGNGTFTVNQFASNTGAFEARVTNIVRQDGLPDDCGNPPAPPVGPKPPIIQPPPSPPIPTVDDDGNPGPDIIFEPRVGPIFVGPLGEINIPVTVNVGGPTFNTPITIPVNVGLPDFNPTFNFGGSGGIAGDGDNQEPTGPVGVCCEGPIIVRGPGLPEEPEDPPEDPPGPNDKIVGVVIVSDEQGGNQRNSEYFNAKPTLLVPRIATVQFEVEVGGALFFAPDQSVKSRRQVVAAPTIGNVTRALIEWENGWQGAFEYLYEAKNNRE